MDTANTQDTNRYACHMDPKKHGPGDSQLRYLWAEICELRRRVMDLEAENCKLREGNHEGVR